MTFTRNVIPHCLPSIYRQIPDDNLSIQNLQAGSYANPHYDDRHLIYKSKRRTARNLKAHCLSFTRLERSTFRSELQTSRRLSFCRNIGQEHPNCADICQPFRRANKRSALSRLIATTLLARKPECVKSFTTSPAERNGKSLPKTICEIGTMLIIAPSEVGLLALAVSLCWGFSS
jgi:hypothetical protein